jgi:hypothetical protein
MYGENILASKDSKKRQDHTDKGILEVQPLEDV